MRRIAFTASLVFLCFLTLIADIKIARAFKSGENETHQFIFTQAKDILATDGFTSLALFLDEVDPATNLTYLEIMIRGSDENDRIDQAREHYIDPMDHKGLWFLTHQKSAATLCQERFDQAQLYWQNGDYYNAMYYLGWAAHMVQDICVPHHAWTAALDWHSEYEAWVDTNKHIFAVSSDGVYSLPSFLERQYYSTYNSGPPNEAGWHYNGTSPTAYDWVDYNAHESIKHFLSVNSYSSQYVTDAANPYIETIHPLPNNITTTWVINTTQTSGMQLHFEQIDIETNFDFIFIYDKNDNLLDSYTGFHTNLWTPWYPVGDILKIRMTTDHSVQSWGYKLNEVKYYDPGEDVYGTASVLLPRAQRTTAGFIKFFFDEIFDQIRDVAITSISPSKTAVGQGYPVSVNVTVVNQGNLTESFNMTLYANASIIDMQENVVLSAGNSTVLTFDWNTTEFSMGNYTLSGEVSVVPGESDLSDNLLVADVAVCVTITGDVDGDSDVDIFDMVRLAGVYGVSQPNPSYDPNSDIDDDGDIDIFDVVIAAGNYGENW